MLKMLNIIKDVKIWIVTVFQKDMNDAIKAVKSADAVVITVGIDQVCLLRQSFKLVSCDDMELVH